MRNLLAYSHVDLQDCKTSEVDLLSLKQMHPNLIRQVVITALTKLTETKTKDRFLSPPCCFQLNTVHFSILFLIFIKTWILCGLAWKNILYHKKNQTKTLPNLSFCGAVLCLGLPLQLTKHDQQISNDLKQFLSCFLELGLFGRIIYLDFLALALTVKGVFFPTLCWTGSVSIKTIILSKP